MPFRFKNKNAHFVAPSAPAPKKSASSLIGKTVFFTPPEEAGSAEDRVGLKFAGVVAAIKGETAVIRMAVPNEAGILLVGDSVTECPISDVTPFDGATIERKMRHFDTQMRIDRKDNMAYRIVSGGKMITLTGMTDEAISNLIVDDYQDVIIAGYLSTFQSTTPSDRDGDYVMPGAFSDTLNDFKKNPVILTDHVNMVRAVAGYFTKISQDTKGLAVEGRITNSPAEHMVDLRFKLVEGSVKSLSMGGLLMYNEDGRGIEKVILYEGTICAIPANPDALISVRSLDLEDMTKTYKMLGRKRLNLKGLTA